jgi:5,10-methylenetetrahydromethanopterin reductase
VQIGARAVEDFVGEGRVGIRDGACQQEGPGHLAEQCDGPRSPLAFVESGRFDDLCSPIRIMHPGTNAPRRPIDIPVLVSALGPKGLAVTHEIADGLVTVNGETAHAHEFTWTALGIHGTVLGEDAPLNSPRARAAAGPGNALAYHAAYESGGDPTSLPGGQAWLDTITAHPHSERHLAVHDQHLTDLNAADNAAWNAGSWQAVTSTTVTGTPDHIRDQLSAYAQDGITEIVYQPTGPDIPGELERFIAVAGDVHPDVRHTRHTS